jgi:hypothetical protein
LEELECRIELSEHALQRELDQRMVVDYENLHRSPPDVKMRAVKVFGRVSLM